MKKTSKFIIYILFMFAVLNVNNTVVKATNILSHCLYIGDDDNYLIFSKYSKDLSSNIFYNSALDFYVNGETYHSGSYLSNGNWIDPQRYDITFRNWEKDGGVGYGVQKSSVQPQGFIFIEKEGFEQKFDAYAYDDSETRNYIVSGKVFDELFYDIYSLSFDCIEYDYDDESQVKAAYNKAKGTRLESLFKEIVESKPEIGDPDNWEPADPYNPEVGDLDCTSLLGSPNPEPGKPKTPAYYITFAFKIIRYVAIIILVVFSVMDFVSATASHDDDELKNAFNKTIKRFILCIIIFLLPSLISYILSLIHGKAIELCISTNT